MVLSLSKHWKKKLLVASIFACLAIFALARVYYSLTDDFRLANIRYDIPNRTEWEIAPLDPSQKNEIDKILSQQFTYIGKGAQSYAFGSADGKHVIKFFKFKHLRPSIFLDLMPPIFDLQNYSKKQYQRKERKLEGVFSGYRLAYEMHRKDSGLVYIHLNTTENQFPKLVVKDKMGWQHTIPLDDVVFILQDYATTARAVISKLLMEGDVEAVKQKIDKIYDLYLSEYAKGIFDNDHGVMRNVGFVADRAIRIDVGKLKNYAEIKSLSYYSKDLVMTADRMLAWFSHNEKNAYPYLKAYVENKITNLVNEPYTFTVEKK